MRALLISCSVGLLLGLTGCSKDDTDSTAETVKKSAAATEKAMKKTPTDPAAGAAAAAAPKPAEAKPAMAALTSDDRKRLEATVASSFGKGSFKTAEGETYSFTVEGSVLNDDSSYGKFRFYSFHKDGKMDIKGEMECVAINSGERKIWMSGRIVENVSSEEKYRSGQYATGNYVQFRARPNSMDGKHKAEMQVPEFVDAESAKSFCKQKNWAAEGLYELGQNDLIAAIP